MKYHAPTKQFLIDRQALELVALSVPYVIKHIRLLGGLPLDKYEADSPLTNADYAMRGVLEIARTIGIETGAEWGNELDVRNAG